MIFIARLEAEQPHSIRANDHALAGTVPLPSHQGKALGPRRGVGKFYQHRRSGLGRKQRRQTIEWRHPDRGELTKGKLGPDAMVELLSAAIDAKSDAATDLVSAAEGFDSYGELTIHAVSWRVRGAAPRRVRRGNSHPAPLPRPRGAPPPRPPPHRPPFLRGGPRAVRGPSRGGHPPRRRRRRDSSRRARPRRASEGRRRVARRVDRAEARRPRSVQKLSEAFEPPELGEDGVRPPPEKHASEGSGRGGASRARGAPGVGAGGVGARRRVGGRRRRGVARAQHKR